MVIFGVYVEIGMLRKEFQEVGIIWERRENLSELIDGSFDQLADMDDLVEIFCYCLQGYLLKQSQRHRPKKTSKLVDSCTFFGAFLTRKLPRVFFTREKRLLLFARKTVTSLLSLASSCAVLFHVSGSSK